MSKAQFMKDVRKQLSRSSGKRQMEEMSAGERGHFLEAAINSIGFQSKRRGCKDAEDILEFISEYPDVFGKMDAVWDDDTSEAEQDILLKREVRRIRDGFSRPEVTAFDRRIAWLGNLTGLSSLDCAIAALLTRRRIWPAWSALAQKLFSQSGPWLETRAIAAMLGVPTSSVSARLERHRPLMMGGLIEDHGDDDVAASDFLVRLGKLRSTAPARLAAAMLQPEPSSTLEWQDFAHFQAERDLAANLLSTAARRRQNVNLLLHGIPGTGKTEFARALADRLGLQAVFVGKADDEGGEPSRKERIAHLTVVRALTKRSREHLIVIDEADDLIISPWDKGRSDSSKLWINHIIEKSTGPTIWIVNEPAVLGGPVIRRMSAAIGFAMPPAAVRERIIARHADSAGLNLKDQERRALGRLTIPPAVAAHAVRAASLTDRSSSTIEQVAVGLGEALGIRRLPAQLRQPAPFDPSLSHADCDLLHLAAKLGGSGDKAWSMLLEGVSGTGKSAYARYLAEALGLELIERRGSDLLGAFVGETEEKIAKAFSEAAKSGALLLLDEADALLRDRRDANRGWEVSMTNEMLSWMERHPAPFIVTTNLADTLDPATTRRFLFRIRFEPLDATRAAALWEHYFDDLAPVALGELEGLTPSDFALVARRVSFTGEARSDQRLAMLRAEVLAKPFRTARIGFGGTC